MELQKRVARERFEYAGRNLVAGDEFDCEVQHLELLLALGKIEPKRGEAGYKTRHMTARESA